MTADSPSQRYLRVTRRGNEFDAVGDLQVELGRPIGSGGVFASWSWDGSRLTLRNDRYGFFPVFYVVTGDGIAVSNSLVELIRRRDARRLDVDALNVFHRLGFFLGEDTPLAEVKVLPPSAVLVWDGELSIEHHRELGGRLQLTREEAVAGYTELFRVAVRRHLTDEPFAVPLSGGRDSRHLLLELLAEDSPPQYTITGSDWLGGDIVSTDLDVARELARDLGLPHVEVPRLSSRVETEIRKNILTHFCADEHSWLVPVGDALADVEVYYDGIGGDVLSAGLFQSSRTSELAAAGRLEELAEAIMGDWGDSRAESLSFGLADGRSASDLYESRRERVVRELELVAGAENPVALFYFYNRTRREIALVPFGVLGTRASALCPYLDHELVTFLLSLPNQLLVDHSFHTNTIAFAHPDHAARPYAVDRPGVPAPREWRRQRRDILWRGVRARPWRAARVASMEARKVAGSRRGAVFGGPPPALWLLYLWQLQDELARA